MGGCVFTPRASCLPYISSHVCTAHCQTHLPTYKYQRQAGVNALLRHFRRASPCAVPVRFACVRACYSANALLLHIPAYIYVRACVRACTCVCVCVCMRACLRACVRACMRVLACVLACMRVLACVLACLRVFACMRVKPESCNVCFCIYLHIPAYAPLQGPVAPVLHAAFCPPRCRWRETSPPP